MKKYNDLIVRFIAVWLFVALLSSEIVWAEPYDLTWNNIGGGGMISSTVGNYELSGSIALQQTDQISAIDYDANSGFWPVAAWEVLRGDVTGNGLVDLEDFSELTMLWFEVSCMTPYWCDGTDLNWNNQVEINDLMVLTDHWLQQAAWHIP